ncbi:predicted protein [Histoplasma capsulatum var. duboisii H88]|uniref:Predicted protein n=1 Tax=Ajellomyces capsulatus (strain H88) TaxID=544711 RepID=F0USK5_AJEC8|nr:predicted protein [Histoplasma capsulatum var. duboisii H88]
MGKDRFMIASGKSEWLDWILENEEKRRKGEELERLITGGWRTSNTWLEGSSEMEVAAESRALYGTEGGHLVRTTITEDDESRIQMATQARLDSASDKKRISTRQGPVLEDHNEFLGCSKDSTDRQEEEEGAWLVLTRRKEMIDDDQKKEGYFGVLDRSERSEVVGLGR